MTFELRTSTFKVQSMLGRSRLVPTHPLAVQVSVVLYLVFLEAAMYYTVSLTLHLAFVVSIYAEATNDPQQRALQFVWQAAA